MFTFHVFSVVTGLIATWLMLMSSTSQDSSFSSCSKNSRVSRNLLCSGSDSHSFSKTTILSISSCWLCFQLTVAAIQVLQHFQVPISMMFLQLLYSFRSLFLATNCRTSRMRLLPWDRVFWSKCIQNIFKRFQKHFTTDVWDCRELLNPYDWSLSDRNCEMTL